MKYAQIYNNKAWWIFDADKMPQFAPNIIIKDITNIIPQPQEGWDYNAVTNTFIVPTVPIIPTQTLADIKQAKINQINILYIQKLSDGFQSSVTGISYIFGYAPSDQMKFMQLAILVLSNMAVFPVAIPAKDNTIVMHTLAQYQQLVGDIALFAQAQNAKQHDYINQVNLCQNISDVNKIILIF